jgi:argininosuccinate lyase
MRKGRFQLEPSDLVKRFSESVSFDWRLFAHDVRGSIAHAAALARAGIITAAELKKIQNGLVEIEHDIRAGRFEWKPELEDVHMNIEAALTRKIGPAGGKLHTARSRNDQVALDLRLYCRDEVAELIGRLRLLQQALVECGSKFESTILPGYTHLQRGQPVLFAHHLLAYVEMLERDADRFADTARRLDVLPLGSGALAGSTIVLDREFIARQLGFSALSRNSMDAVSDRDFVIEIIFAIALAGVHLSRLAEDIIIWTSAEFGYVTLDDAHATGSSLMPQKKNPDIAELTRGKTGRLTGNLMGILTVLKGLPMSYNRDLQEDKERLFDSIDTIKLALAVNAEMIRAMKVNESVCRTAAADPFLLATDLADYLVKKGLPFRQAHEIIGRLTTHSLATGRSFADMPVAELREFSPLFAPDVADVLEVMTALKARTATGAPSPANVGRELRRWTKRLSNSASADKASSSTRKRPASRTRGE